MQLLKMITAGPACIEFNFPLFDIWFCFSTAVLDQVCYCAGMDQYR